MNEHKRVTRETDEQIAAREKRLKQEEKKTLQLRLDREALLADTKFQRVMADILTKGGMFRSVMTGNSMTYHLSGRQDFAREIWSDFAAINQSLAFDLLKPKFGETFDDA